MRALLPGPMALIAMALLSLSCSAASQPLSPTSPTLTVPLDLTPSANSPRHGASGGVAVEASGANPLAGLLQPLKIVIRDNPTTAVVLEVMVGGLVAPGDVFACALLLPADLELADLEAELVAMAGEG